MTDRQQLRQAINEKRYQRMRSINAREYEIERQAAVMSVDEQRYSGYLAVLEIELDMLKVEFEQLLASLW